MTGLRIARQVSSGGVVVKGAGADAQICLIARRVADKVIWGLPKGHVEPGEQPQDTALREVREETGLIAEPITRIGSISYWFAVKDPEPLRYFKTVHFFLMRYLEGELVAQLDEIDDAAWVPINQALATMSYKNERRIVTKALRLLQQHAAAS